MVACGFGDDGREVVRKDSPTCGRENLRHPHITGEPILWISRQLFAGKVDRKRYLSANQMRLKLKKSCLQQSVLRVDMTMQYFIGIKKTPYKVF